MRHLLLSALALPLTTAASLPAEKPGLSGRSEPACLGDGFALVKKGGKPEVKRLGELPSGALVLTVLLEENGCTKPVIVRQGFGASDGRGEAERVPKRRSNRR